MSKELNCMNCCIGDFKDELCDCDGRFCKEFKKIGTAKDFEKDVLEHVSHISQEDFGILCICALRYCHGRRTYMPSLVQKIVGAHLSEMSDKDIQVMVEDCDFQKRMNLYGDECDKKDWLVWATKVRADQTRRAIEKGEVKE